MDMMNSGSSSSNSGSGSGSGSGSPELLNGLKFGKKIYFEDVGTGVHPKSCSVFPSAADLPPPAPVKKGGGGGGGQPLPQPPRCQVEGCRVDLSDVKAYYSRHKVCGMHSKSPMVIVAGIEQRFCQQCSRFHQLLEFDQGKRSCRRRLAGHNERRRKPQPRSLLSVRYGTLSSSTRETSSRGGFLMDFSTYSKLNGRNPWPTTTTHQGPSNTSSYSGPTGCFAGDSDSSCALSLLSNQSYVSRTESMSLGPTYFTNPIGLQQPLPVGASVDLFSSSSWGNGSTQMHSELGLGQISNLPNSSSQYSGGLEWGPQQSGRQYLELENSRAYDSSSAGSQHIDWSL